MATASHRLPQILRSAGGGSVTATADLPLGATVVTATATVEHPATATLPLGGVTLTVTATVEHPATAALPLGAVFTAATATVEHPATADLPLGSVVVAVAAGVDQAATADLPLGDVTVTAEATVTPTPPAEQTGAGGAWRANYPMRPVPLGKPRIRNASAVVELGGVTIHTAASVTFSIIDDEDELLLVLS